MSKTKNSLPQLNDCGGDLSKKWFVYFNSPDPENPGKLKRYKHYKGFGKLKTKTERYAYADDLIKKYSELLQNGWSPFEKKQSLVFQNNLTYYHAMFGGNNTVSNANFIFYASKMLEKMKDDGYSEANYRLYQSKARQFQHWLIAKGKADLHVSQFSNEIIQDFFFHLDKERKVSGNTYRKYRHVLTAVFQSAIEMKHISVNPVHSLPDSKRIVDTAARPINYEDLIIFMKELQKYPQMQLIAFFQMFCFLRPGREIRLMRIRQINFSRKTILIPAEYSKNKREKRVDIPEFFYQLLREKWNLHTYKRDMYVIGKENKPGWEHLSKNTLRNRFRAMRVDLNMPGEYKLYSLKHTGAVLAYDDNININYIKEQMGHAHSQTTEEYLKNKAGLRNKAFANWDPKLLKDIL